MHLGAIMAQILTLISLVFLLFLAKTFIQTADSDDAGDSSTPTTTYDEWYQSGMDSYTKDEWDDTIYYFEKALEEFKFYRSSLVECRLKCRNATRAGSPPGSPTNGGSAAEMQYFQGLFVKANCIRKCKAEKLGNRPEVIDQEVTDKFLARMPYSYLQFAYYKSFEYEKAVAAAYTYLQWNPDDEVMQNNLDYYRNLHGITEDHLVDLEEQLHRKYFLEGYKAYDKGDYPGVIENMKKALEHYWKVDEECRALCEGKYENREFMDLYEAISNHYASVLYCKNQCEEWNSRMKGKAVENYLANHFHFLQYAHYKEGEIVPAVSAAASFLVLVPNDPTMTTNMHFYEEAEGADKFTIEPWEVVEAYQRRKDTEQKMLQFAMRQFWDEEDEEYLEERYHGDMKSMVYQDQAEPINPDEVLLGPEVLEAIQAQAGQSYADVQGDDEAEVTSQTEEVWADYTEDEESEGIDIEHFPEDYFTKPEEIWPEEEFDILEEEEEDGPVREYSPEPGVIYGAEDRTDDAETGVHGGEKDSTPKIEEVKDSPRDGDERYDGRNSDDEDAKPKVRTAESIYSDSKNSATLNELQDEAEVKSQDYDSINTNSAPEGRNQGSPSNTEAGRTESNGLKKDEFIDPNLGYRVDESGIKWPDINKESTSVGETVHDHKPNTNVLAKDASTDNKSQDKKEEETPKTSKKVKRAITSKIKRTGLPKSLPETEDIEGISALDQLKQSVKEQHLLPSGPPRAGPSIHGRRYAEDVEETEKVEEPYTPSLDGVRLYMNGAMLNGSNRMAADDIATQMECDNLIKLIDIESKMGDGYNGKVYPHTKFESFEGMTVSVAVNAARVGRVPLVLPATYMHLAEKSRIFMKKYFNLKNELFFSYTHLVCRTAEPDSKLTRKDFSHPIHADNCQLDENGVCHKTPPSFTWRDWSAVLYLNEDFLGGEFVFAHPNFTIQSHLRPKCGRLVGFSAGEENLHGVKGVLSGRRCALALWFTEDPHHQEEEFNVAAVMFRKTWEEQEAQKKSREAAAKTEL